uniref:Translation initiation factor eIF2B subunit delta n=1 Tax=Lygus hesperus TaxID=30085 RepID=A0A0K8SNA4_LYGHE
MDCDKPPRDDVKAQREAKKLAKLAKKNKSGGGGTEMAPAQPDPKVKQTNKSTPQKAQTPNNIQNAQNSSPVTVVTTQMNKISLDSVDGEIVKPVRTVGQVVPPVAKTGPISEESSGISEKSSGLSERSREEILAEREAKKLAKLAAKTKKKDGVADQPKGDQIAAVNDISAPTSLEAVGSNAHKDVNHVGNDGSTTEKSKAALRAERRAKQEAQRAAKEGAKKDIEKTKPAIKAESIKEKPKSTQKAQTQSKPQVLKTAAAKSHSNQPKLLSHLLTDKKPLPAHIYQNVHPAIVELGAKYAARVVSGSNARCIALLQALKRVIVDFVTPREKEFSRAMETRLNDSLVYLNSCRQSSVSMTNALRHVKSHLTQLTTENTTDDDARKKLCEVIDTFIKEQIDVAGEAISLAVAQKISNGDTNRNIRLFFVTSSAYSLKVIMRAKTSKWWWSMAALSTKGGKCVVGSSVKTSSAVTFFFRLSRILLVRRPKSFWEPTLCSQTAASCLVQEQLLWQCWPKLTTYLSSFVAKHTNSARECKRTPLYIMN